MFHRRTLSAPLAAVLAAGCALPPPEPEAPAPPTDLGGVIWGLETLDGEQAPPGASLSFGETEVRGAGLCNRFFGGFARDGATVAIGPIAATRRACPNLETEQRYLGALTDVVAFAIADGRLTLYGEGGVALMTFLP